MAKILVIEDDKSIRDNITQILTLENYEVFEAANGAIGVHLALKHLPDLIISDIMMPRMDGYEVLEKVRANAETTHIPFVFLTMKSEKESLRKGMNLGADDYLNKPFTIEELLYVIETRLKKSEILDKKAEKKLNDFRASVALHMPHEFNTPLTGIIGSLDLIINYFDTFSREEIKEMLVSMQSPALRLQKTVERMLLYAHLELIALDKGRVAELQKEKTNNIALHIENIVNKLTAKTNRIADIEFDIEPCTLRIQQDYFITIVDELIDNALKFSEEKEKIIISGKKGKFVYELKVEDHGRGMNKREIENIGAYVQFKRNIFEQQGSGLGLAIVRTLSIIFNGDYRIESEEDFGTIVVVEIPILEKTG